MVICNGSIGIIGEEVIFDPRKAYYYTTRVMSDKAVVYVVKRKNFKDRFDPKTKEGMKKIMNEHIK